jgi:hypothetical protein
MVFDFLLLVSIAAAKFANPIFKLFRLVPGTRAAGHSIALCFVAPVV